MFHRWGMRTKYILVFWSSIRNRKGGISREKNSFKPLPPPPPPPTHTHTDHHHHHHALHPHSPTPLHLYLRWMDILGWFSAISHHGDNVCDFPTPPEGTWRSYNVGSTSMQRHDVASPLRRRCINVMCPLGRFSKEVYCKRKVFTPYSIGKAFPPKWSKCFLYSRSIFILEAKHFWHLPPLPPPPAEDAYSALDAIHDIGTAAMLVFSLFQWDGCGSFLLDS